jgi:hypothetical protein
LHIIVPDGQAQTPLLQICVSPHWFPHDPQSVVLECRFVHRVEQTSGLLGGHVHALLVHT